MSPSNFLLFLMPFVAFNMIGVSCAPVPIPESENMIEEDGLIVLVPTVPVDAKGQPTKREIDYELISIPGDLIRKTVKEVTQTYGTRGGPLPSEGTHDNTIGSLLISSSNYGGGTTPGNDINSLSTVDLSKLLSSLASTGFSAAATGANIAGQAKNVLSTATRVGTSAVVGGTQAVRWVVQQKASGLRSFAEFAGVGLQYAGRLTSAVLKVLLRIPGIKAKIISDLIQAGQPLASALSDVISESADDLGDVFSAHTDIFRDAVHLLFKLIQDALALQGRVLASFSAGGLDKGANLVSSAVKVGSAFVRAAGDTVSAVGRGVGELVEVVSKADLPPPPSLPTIKLPVLPTISYPSSSSSGDSYGPPPSSSYHSSSSETKDSYSS